MSLILGIVTTNETIIVGDGRAKNSISNVIIDEKCDKTRKINDNVILGFSGELEFSLWLLDQFENICKQYILKMKSDEVANILCRIAQEGMRYKESNNLSTRFQMLVAGINSKKETSLYSFGVPTNFKISEQIPVAYGLEYSILYPGKTDFGYVFEKILLDNPGRKWEFYFDLFFLKPLKLKTALIPIYLSEQLKIVKSNNYC